MVKMKFHIHLFFLVGLVAAAVIPPQDAESSTAGAVDVRDAQIEDAAPAEAMLPDSKPEQVPGEAMIPDSELGTTTGACPMFCKKTILGWCDDHICRTQVCNRPKCRGCGQPYCYREEGDAVDARGTAEPKEQASQVEEVPEAAVEE